MAADKKYAWNLPPVSRSSSLAAADLLREIVSVLTESLQEDGWSIARISEETRRLDETVREVASSFDSDLVAAQLAGMFYLEIESALVHGPVSQAEGKKEPSVESIAARRIDDSLAVMGLVRERYLAFSESLHEKAWSAARIMEEGGNFGKRLQWEVSGFNPRLLRLGRAWVFLQEAMLRASQFPADSPMSGKAVETRKEVGALSKTFVNDNKGAPSQFPRVTGAGAPTYKPAHKFKDGEKVQVKAAGDSGKALVGRDIPAMQDFYLSVALGSRGKTTEGRQVLKGLFANNRAGTVYSGTKAVVVQYAVESGPEALRTVTCWERLVRVRFEEGEVAGLEGWMDDCEIEARAAETPIDRNSPVLNESQTTVPKDNWNDDGTLYLPPSDEAKTILSLMTEEERLNFNDLLGRLQAWHESVAGTDANRRQGMRRSLLPPEIRAPLWGTALAKIADHYRDIGRLDKALFFSESAWNVSKYPVFAYNAALLAHDIGDNLHARTLLLTYLAEYRNAMANPLFALVNPEAAPDELEQVANSARAKLADLMTES